MAEEYIKVGTVEAVEGTRVTVRFEGKGDTATLSALDNRTKLENGEAWTQYAAGGTGEAEYASHRHGIARWVPEVGDRVVCLMLMHGQGQGFVVGTI